MNKTLPEVISEILRHNGAVVEEADDGCLEFLASGTLAKKLRLPEHGRLRFGYAGSSSDEIPASYDSELFKEVAGLLKGKGEFSAASFKPSYLPDNGKLLKNLNDTIALNNASFRPEKTEIEDISYLLCYFRYTALSDEKREGIIKVLINEMNLSSVPFGNGLDRLEDTVEGSKDIERHDLKKVCRASHSAAARMAKEGLKDFMRSLERRLNRDIRRVHEYYDTLGKEAESAMEKSTRQVPAMAVSSGDGPAGEEDMNMLLKKKLSAIETERRWKVNDLITKYSLNIQIEPVSIIRIETQAPVFMITIKRRLAARSFPVAYNPLVKQLDDLPCESCFNPTKPYYICDGSLHIICSECYKTCPDCGKQYCAVCHKNKCPKCKKEKNSSAIK